MKTMGENNGQTNGKKHILVVDDDPGILESLQFLLEDAGYCVAISEDGSVFRDKSICDQLDLILLDYWLPRQNGGEIAKKLKSDIKTAHIPVIMISASYKVKELTKKAGADDFLPKPYDMDVLLGMIEKYTS